MESRSIDGDSSSGTFSTICTSSRASLAGELDLALQWVEVEDDEEKLMKRRQRARCVLEGFCHGNTGAAERWLSELGVGWVLGLADNPSAWTSLLRRQRNNLTKRWIRALTGRWLSELGVGCSDPLAHGRWIWALREITGFTVHFVGEQYVPDPASLVRFVEATVLKMLPFVDALLLAAADPLDAGTDTADATNGAQPPSGRKLQTLLDVRDAVSRASKDIRLCFGCCGSSVKMETQRSRDQVLSLLSAKVQRLDEAVWNTMEEVRTSILNDGGSNKWGKTRQESPDICKVTRSLVTYIKYLWSDYWRVGHIVRTATELGNYYVTDQGKTNPLATLAVEMVHSVQLKLDERSETFPDHSLRFLFLINNTHFIWQQLHPLLHIQVHIQTLATEIEEYIQKYLQMSWEQVLSCLFSHTPRRFIRKDSPLPKFDSEFQKTYAAQKLWKVPDPGLRTRLRKAIVKEVVPRFTNYLEDHDITSPGITPQEREEMLLELFEG